MRTTLAFTLAALLLATTAALAGSTGGPGGPTLASPLTHPSCEDTPEPELFAPWESQLENLVFDGQGHLFVTDLGGDRLLRMSPDGSVEVLLEDVGVAGITQGPDGSIYMAAAEPALAPLVGGGRVDIWRLMDTAPVEHEIHASGLPMVNGMAFDGVGNLYVSTYPNPTSPFLIQVPADEPEAWQAWGDPYSANGLWHDAEDGSLLVAVTNDQASPILRIPLDAPNDHQVVANLTFGVATLQPGVHAPSDPARPLVPKGLDDLTLAPDGMVYVTAHLTGELLRVDPATGEACVYVAGLNEPTSVRVADAFGEHTGDLFITEMGGVGVSALVAPAEGAVWRVPLPG